MKQNYNVRFLNIVKQILDSPNSTVGFPVRPRYKDGEPAHTKFITNVVESFDISKGEFPIQTLRPTAWRSAIQEYFWIFQKQTSDLSELHDLGVTYWDAWNIGDGSIGRRYGETVSEYNLMNKLLNGIKLDPYGRRHIIDLYQYADFEMTRGLYPCQFMHHFQVRGEYLDLTTTIRSSDYLVAGTINKIQAIAFLMMVAHATGYKPGMFYHDQRNVHIYDRHIDNALELIRREGEASEKSPKLIFNPKSNNFYEFTIDDFELIEYEPVKPNLVFELGE